MRDWYTIRGSVLTKIYNQTDIPLMDLYQIIEKEKNQARELNFCVHLRDTEKKTHTNHCHDWSFFD